ncbi:MAG: VTT domain-containing protein, partial [Acidobacteriota bacterium]
DTTGKRGGVWHIFLLRTVPIIPFRILDLAYGLTSVPLRKYLAVSAIAMPVRIFWIQFVVAALGGAVFDITRAMAYFEQNRAALWLSFLYLMVSIIIVVCLRRKLK